MRDWKEFKLGDLVSVNERSIGRNFNYNLIEYIDTSSVTENRFDIPTHTTLLDAPSRAKRLIANGDTIISTVRPIQKHYGFIKNAKENQVVSTGFAVVTPKKIDARFLYYFLTQAEITEYLNTIAEGGTTTFPTFKADELKVLKIKLPDLKTQAEIAEILSSIDDKIELNNKINKELEELAQTLFKQWFIDFEFLNENGEPYKSSGGEMVESEFGDIPKGWKIGKIGDYIKFIKGKKPLEVFDTESENTLPQILIETLDTGKSMYARPEKMTICEKEDLIMVMDGASSGRIEMGFRGILGSTLAIIKSYGINNNLLYQFLKYKESDIRNNTTGAAIPHTDKSKIFEYTISIPTENIVSNFNSIQANISKMIFSNKSELKSLTHLRDTILPKLISGELKVNQINN